jgi:hypothetical protein
MLAPMGHRPGLTVCLRSSPEEAAPISQPKRLGLWYH